MTRSIKRVSFTGWGIQYLRLTVTLLGEKKIRFRSCRQVRHAVTGIQERGPFSLGKSRIGFDLARLVVTKGAVKEKRRVKDGYATMSDASFLPVITVFYLPSTFAVDIFAITALNIIGHNVKRAIIVLAQQTVQESLDDGEHARRQHDDGDIVLLGPVIELLEVRIQLHFLQELFDTFIVRRLDRIHHLPERLAKGLSAPQYGIVSLAASGNAEAELIRLEEESESVKPPQDMGIRRYQEVIALSNRKKIVSFDSTMFLQLQTYCL